MHVTGITPILNVSDVPASLHWFEGLGWRRGFTHNNAGMIAGAAESRLASTVTTTPARRG